MKIHTLTSISLSALLSGFSASAHTHNLLVDTSIEITTNHPIEHLHDGTSDTAYIRNGGLGKGESIVFELPAPLENEQIIAVPTGRLPGDKAQLRTEDVFDGAVLEYSSDQRQTWQRAGGIKCELIIGTIPAGATHLRLLATKDVNHRFSVNDPEVFAFDPIISETRSIEINGHNVELSVYAQLDPEGTTRPQLEQIIELYFEYWPKIAALIGSPIDDTQTHLDLILFPGLSFPGFNFYSRIVLKAEHVMERPQDIEGMFVHELTHFVQTYTDNAPLWIVEGIADYSRYKLTRNERWETGFLKGAARREPLRAYSASASFFLYLDDTYQKPITRQISMALNDGTYGEATWKKLTGKSLGQLCVDYAKNTEWTPSPR